MRIRAVHAAVGAVPSPRAVNPLGRLWWGVDSGRGRLFLTVLLLASAAGDASAQRHGALQAESSDSQAEAEATYVEEYRIPLGLGYVAAPIVATGMAAWLTPDPPYTWLWGVTWLTAPVVHWAHGNVWGGFRSLLGMTLTPSAGGLLGYGLARAGDACREDSSSGACIGSSIAAGVGGAILGYFLFAVVDVVLFGEVERAKPSQQALVAPHIAPVLGPAGAKNPSASELQGLTLGATLHL